MPAKKVKVSNVASASFHPWAECLGVGSEPSNTPCQVKWEHDQSPVARDQAKKHAERFPGHSVRVVTEKVDLYRGEVQ